MNTGRTIIHRFLERLTGFALLKPASFVLLAVILTIFAIYYVAANISIQTDTDEMIDPNLPFRKTYDEFNKTFPQFANSFVIVIDGDSPEAAEATQAELYRRLAPQTRLYKSVYAPGAGEFFETNGFLYLDFDKLVALSDQLASAEPVLAAIAEDQSLRGLLNILSDAVDDILEGDEPPEKLTDVLQEMTETAQASDHGDEAPLSWQGIFLDEEDLKDAKRRLLILQPELDFTQFHSAKAALDAARTVAAEVAAANGPVTMRFTGKIALNADELKSVSDGALLSGTLSLILVALVLGFGLRSTRLVLAALATLVIGLVWTGAFGLWAVGYFNIISVAFAVLFIGLGIDFAIHFVLRYQEEVRGGHNTNQALIKASSSVGAPLALCAPTTALAFYAFVPTDYAGLAQLGLISGTGMFISFFTSLTLLPALLALMPLAHGKKTHNPHAKREAGFLAKNGRGIAVVGFALGALALILVPKVDFDFDPINLKDPRTESVAAFFDLLDGGKTSPYVIQIMATSIDEVATIKAAVKPLPQVDEVITLESYVPKNQDAKLDVIDVTSLFMEPVFLVRGTGSTPSEKENIDAIRTFREKAVQLQAMYPTFEVTPAVVAFANVLSSFETTGENGNAKRQLLAANLFAYFPALLDRLEAGLLARPVTLQDLPDGITSRYRAENGHQRLEVFPAETLNNAKSVEDFVLAVSEKATQATGSPVQIYNAGIIVKTSMAQASITAGVIIVLFLLLVLRRFSSVALITVPVALAAVLTGALMVLLDLSFNFANVIVIPLLIGLGVDSGIHLVYRAHEEEKRVKLLSSSTPKAVLLSALTTVGSFGTLALSSHLGTASMGILLTISIFMILLATLLVLPGLMIWLENSHKNTDS